jgi:hypothetical protein
MTDLVAFAALKSTLEASEPRAVAARGFKALLRAASDQTAAAALHGATGWKSFQGRATEHPLT